MTEDLAVQPYLWLTTTGRRTGLPRTVELWFGLEGHTVYLLAGGGDRADWVQNALATPEVNVQLGGQSYRGGARAPQDGAPETEHARRLLAAKYQGWTEGRPLSRWASRAFCLAIDLEMLDAMMRIGEGRDVG